MTRRIRAMLRGAGSVMALGPMPHAYQRLLSEDTVSDRLGAIWTRVGGYIETATEKVRDESPTFKEINSIEEID